MEFGVFHCSTGLICNAPKQFEIVLSKLLAAILRINLNNAKSLTSNTTQRHAHHRTDFKIHNTLAGLHPAILAGIITQKCLLLLQALFNNTFAESCAGFVLWPSGFYYPGYKLIRVCITHDDKTAIGLFEQLKHTIYCCGQKLVKFQHLAKRTCNFQQ